MQASVIKIRASVTDAGMRCICNSVEKFSAT